MYIKELLPLYELCDHCTDIVVFIVVICSVKNSTVKSFIFVDIKFVIFNKRGRYFSMAYMYLDFFFEPHIAHATLNVCFFYSGFMEDNFLAYHW